MANAQSGNNGGFDAPGVRMICPACNLTYGRDILVCTACGTGLLEIPDAPILSGTLLDGRYDIDGVVGTGGMGTVYRARQRGMERAVAIKVMHAHFAHQPRAVKRFFREAQAASRLVHPNIVTVYDFGRSAEGHLYMVMELLEGLTLGDLIHYRAPLAPALAIAIASQICDALDEAHRRRIVHRDLKPDNVLVTTVEDGLWAKVLDFGIARAMRDPDANLNVQNSTVEIAGTPAYMSPEQILGKEPDPRSDLYSLGVMLFEMLTKRRPFDDENSVALCMKQLNEVPAKVSNVREGLEGLDDVVAMLLEKKADARPVNARTARERLLACPQASGPLDLSPLVESPRGGLGVKTTRADAAVMMAQPTLDNAINPIAGAAPLSDVIDRFKEAELAELGGLAFPKGSVSVEQVAKAGATALPPSRKNVDRPRRSGAVGALASMIAEHPSVLKSGVVATWLAQRANDDWAITAEAQKVILRLPLLPRESREACAGRMIEALQQLQERALDANIALRIGVATASDDRLAEVIDLTRRLAASSAHGRVALPQKLGQLLDLDVTPQTNVFLPNGEHVDSVAVQSRGRDTGLLWGRSIQLRRLGQLADEARRSGPVCVTVTGARGMGRSSLVKTFTAGRRNVFVRVSPGARMWPGHTAARILATALGLGQLTGDRGELEGLRVPARDRELIELLMCDTATDEPPAARAISRLLLDHLRRYAEGGPLLIVLDDAHLIDRASQHILDQLVELAQDQPWCFIATSRWLKPGMLFAATHRIDLRSLSMRAANAILATLGVPPRRRHLIISAAQGNPLVMTLLAGADTATSQQVLGDAAINRLLPEALRGASPEVAEAAWLSAATGEPAAETLAAQAARLYLDAGLTTDLADWLSARLTLAGPVMGRLATAWRDPRPNDSVVRAERCERLGLWRLAAVEYEASLSLVKPEQRGAKQLRAAHMRARAGDIRGALACYDASINSSAVHHRPTELLRFAAVLLDIGEKERADQVLDQAQVALDPAGEARSMAEILALKARAAVRRNDASGAMDWLSQAAVAADRLRRTDARAARSLGALIQEIRAEVAVAEGDLETGRTNLRQARDAFRDLGCHADAIRCLVDLGRIELECGEPSRAPDTFRAAVRLASAAGLGAELRRAEVGLGEALVKLGDVEEGSQVLRRCLRKYSDDESQVAYGMAAVAMAQVMNRRGLWADAIRYAERARAASRDARVIARAQVAEAEAWGGQGQLRKMLRALNDAAAVASEAGDGLLSRRIESIYASVNQRGEPLAAQRQLPAAG